MIIGLAGAACAGKSASAAYLEREYGFTRTRFAGPLKAMLRGYLTHIGIEAGTIERMIEGDLKEKPCDELSGATPRYTLQTLGTEWGREFIAEDFWINAWQAQVTRLLRSGVQNIVVEDCRFLNEASAVRAAGGFVLQIKRSGTFNPAAGHKSEGQPLDVDCSIYNDGPLEILHARLDGILDRQLRPARVA